MSLDATKSLVDETTYFRILFLGRVEFLPEIQTMHKFIVQFFRGCCPRPVLGGVSLGKTGKSIYNNQYIEDITRLREDMDFMFEWQEQYLTSERSERVRYCSLREHKIHIFELPCHVLFIIWTF